MQGFSGHLDLRAYKAGQWVLLNDLSYTAKSGETYTAPKWMITDLASIPWLVQPIFGEESRPAGAIHDWLYCSQFTTRKHADELFREMVEFLGTNKLKSQLMYAGLRVGGAVAWNKSSGPSPETFALEYGV